MMFKGGKPRLPPGTAKTTVLSCKVTAVQMSICDQLAATHGIERSEVIRRAIHVAGAVPQLLASDDGAKVEQTFKNFLREIVVEVIQGTAPEAGDARRAKRLKRKAAAL